jgi:hypothetical protein
MWRTVQALPNMEGVGISRAKVKRRLEMATAS